MIGVERNRFTSDAERFIVSDLNGAEVIALDEDAIGRNREIRIQFEAALVGVNTIGEQGKRKGKCRNRASVAHDQVPRRITFADADFAKVMPASSAAKALNRFGFSGNGTGTAWHGCGFR
ncbi:MAG: hypothetical protein MK142_09115, partial [Pseudomonadales bacterium]|nr:hypothetical protein [Pseudomonadales bacterium]